MEAINGHTRISVLLKAHPDALEQIVAIAPAFSKLRNPILRRVMAPRTSIFMAARVAGVSPDLFFERMRALGLPVQADAVDVPEATEDPAVPDRITSLAPERFHTFDVRPILESGADPLKQVLQRLSLVPEGDVLTIINTFVPEPLIRLLEDKGFVCGWDRRGPAEIHTFILVAEGATLPKSDARNAQSPEFEQTLSRYAGKMQVLDVRDLEMPGPMHAILDALETLPEGHALYVHHKRVPVFLLPELHDRGYAYALHTIQENAVDMLIFAGGSPA